MSLWKLLDRRLIYNCLFLSFTILLVYSLEYVQVLSHNFLTVTCTCIYPYSTPIKSGLFCTKKGQSKFSVSRIKVIMLDIRVLQTKCEKFKHDFPFLSGFVAKYKFVQCIRKFLDSEKNFSLKSIYETTFQLEIISWFEYLHFEKKSTVFFKEMSKHTCICTRQGTIP